MIPRPLLALLGAVGVCAVAWALLVPPFVVPDEAEHFAYVQSLAENGERPSSSAEQRQFSSEERVARGVARVREFLSDRRYTPAWEPSAERTWEVLGAGRPRDDIRAVGPQANHPPLYYGYQVAPYAAASGGDLFDRLFLMRLFSALLLLVTTVGAWLLIGELTGRDRLLQLAGAACAGLQPMVVFVSAGVNPDALLFAAYAMALWLAVRLVRRPATRGAVAGLVGAVAVAALAKPAGLALVPALVLVLAVVARRRRRRAGMGVGAAVAVGAALVAAGVALEREVHQRAPVDLSPDELRGFFTYLWDFYLPRLPFQHEYAALGPDDPAWTVWVKQAWASFGLLEVQFPDAAYAVLAAVAAAILVAAGAALARGRIRPGGLPLVVFAVTAVCLVVGLHWVDFQAVNDDRGRVFQGRYLLPLMPVAGVAVAAALSHLTRRRALGAAVVLAGMAVLQLVSLATVAGRYFA